MLDAVKSEPQGGFFVSVTIAQAALESKWGRSVLSRTYNNYFGIKAGGSWKGRTVNMKTGEVFGGKNVTVKSDFRVYGSLEESIADRNALLRTQRYKAVEAAPTPQRQAEAIRHAGYCTSTSYVLLLKKIIADNKLEQYDGKTQ